MGKTIEKISYEMKEMLIQMYNEGKMDSEIAKELNVTRGAILYWRRILNLKSKFTYNKVSKINNELFKELFDKRLSDYEIAKKLNMSANGVYSHRKRHGFLRDNLSENKSILISQEELEIIIGTVLGDASLIIPKGSKNAIFSCAHSNKQKDYTLYKVELLKNLKSRYWYSKRKTTDIRTGIFYESHGIRIPANPELNLLYHSFYKNRKKIIPFDLLDNFTARSMAFWFMDDGSKTQHSYQIATNCFEYNDLIKFKEFLFKKFNLECTIQKSNILYIKKCSRETFKQLISPYMCECLIYKLHI